MSILLNNDKINLSVIPYEIITVILCLDFDFRECGYLIALGFFILIIWRWSHHPISQSINQSINQNLHPTIIHGNEFDNL